MDDERSKQNGRRGRKIVTALLGLGFVGACALAGYAHWRQMTRLDGAHLLYLPVILACLWFGWRGLAVAVLGGACLMVPHFIGLAPSNPLEHDVLRMVVLIAVGGVVSILKRRHVRAQREVQKLHRLLNKRQETSEAEYEILNCRLNRQLRDLRDIGEAAQEGNAEKERILDALVEQVVYQDKERRILWVNQAAADSVGLPREALLGRHCYEVWTQGSGPCAECPLSKALDTGQAAQGERITPDGRRWFLQGYPITDEHGAVVAGVEVALDITECRTAQEELQRIFDLSLDLVCIADVKKGTFTKVNPAWERTLGYTEGEMLGRSFLEFVHPDDRDKTVALNREIANKGVKVTCFENRYRAKDGSYRWLSWVSDARQPEGLTYAVARDVTEAKRAEEALAQEWNLLRTLIDNLPDSIYVKDRDSRFLLCNEKVLGCTGTREFADVLGKTDFDLFPRESAERFYAEEQEVIRTGRPLVNRERAATGQTTGELTWYSTTKLPLKDAEGQIIGLVGIARDITDFKRAQEAYRAVVDHSLQGLLVIQDQRIVFANQAMAEISGYSLAEILAAPAQQLHGFVHPDDRERVWDTHRARIEGEAAPRITPSGRYAKTVRFVGWRSTPAALSTRDGPPSRRPAWT